MAEREPGQPESLDGSGAFERAGGATSFLQRAVIRRRVRFLRRRRELALHDLGGFLFESHRLGQPREDLLAGKLAALTALDDELALLQRSLSLREELAVAGQYHTVLDRNIEPVLGVFGCRRVGLADTAHHGREVELGKGALLRTGLDLGNAQQGGEDFQERIGFGDGIVGRSGIFAGRRGALAGVLEALTQAAERRAQIVRDVARYLAQAGHQRLDAVEHGVEAGDELIDLVVGAAHGNARRQIALHDGAAGAGDGVDAAQELSAHQHATGDGEEKREPACPGERTHDGALHVG